jgi:preprotein translocase subunit YajC
MKMDVGTSVLPLLQQDTSGTSMLVTMGMFALILLVFYFLIIRPQRKKEKDTEKMRTNLKKNDKILTIGGIKGIVHQVKDDSVIVKVDDNCKLEFVKNAIASVVESKEGSKEELKEEKTE